MGCGDPGDIGAAISRNELTTPHVSPLRRAFRLRTALRVTSVSVVGSRRLLTHMCAPGRRGSSWGDHALSREVHPPEDRGAPSRAPRVPDRDLGVRHGPHRPGGRRPVQRVVGGGEDRLSHRGHRPRHPARTPADARLPRADPRAADGLTDLRRSRAATDAAVAKIRKNAQNPDVRDAMGQATDSRVSAVLDAFDGLQSLRRSVEDGTVDRNQALGLYNHLVDPCYVLLTNLHVVDNVEMDKQYRALVNLARAREFLSREDALLGSSLVVGKLTRDETRDISDLVAQRTLMYDVNLPLLPASERGHFERFWKNAASAPLRVAERAAASSESGSLHNVTAQTWNTAAGAVLDKLGTLDDQANDRYQDRVRPVAMNVILKAAVAGVLGLIALLFSLFLSVRIGRGLIRDLRQLRLDAHEASGVRLPSVMRRLSVGEVVDVETEVPRLEYDRNEIGDVGQALNTLQRAAVEAAVKQASLRSGVSEVFRGLRQPRPPQPGPAAQAAHPARHHGAQDRGHRRTRRPVPPRPSDDPYASARRGPGDPLRGRPVPAVAQAGPAHGHRPRGRGRGRGLRTHRGPQAAAHRRHRARRRGPHPPGGRTPGERHGVLPAAHRRPGRGGAGRQRLHPGDPRPGPRHGGRSTPGRQPPGSPRPRSSNSPTPTASASSWSAGSPSGRTSASRSSRRPTGAPPPSCSSPTPC